ncbi:MAG: type IV toxin-antitoxin system AbiEi family antitoxin domain-containing protein [Solirubrobacterales bacterium]
MRAEVRTHHGLAELAKRQWGVVSREQLRGLGYSDSAIARAARAGRLHRVHRGAYAVGHSHLTRHGDCLAAVLACGGDALLSHRSAAWLWGLLPSCGLPVEVVVPRRVPARKSIRLHKAPALREEDRAICERIPVTSLPRTLLDLAAVLPARRLERAIERSETLRLFDLRPVEALLARMAGHHGAGRLRRALSLYREPAFTRSDLELRFRALIRGSDLPQPAANVFVEGYELDAYWEPQRFAVELDGFESHRSRAAFEEDRERQENLKMAGIEMVRVTDRRLEREPEVVVRRLEELLRRRRPEPEMD